VVPTVRQNLIPPLPCGPLIADTPGAGTLLPQPLVRAANSAQPRMLDDLTGASVRLLVAYDLTADDVDCIARLLEPLHGKLIILNPRDAPAYGLSVVETDPVMSRWLVSIGQRFVIARPDHYVYGTAATPAETIWLLERLIKQLR
jgi:3-(3-hydroxy-phenyl)propionate hydroxylase